MFFSLWMSHPATLCREMTMIAASVATRSAAMLPARTVEVVVVALGRLRCHIVTQPDVELLVRHLPGLDLDTAGHRRLTSLISALLNDVVTAALVDCLAVAAIPDGMFEAALAAHQMAAAAAV